MSGPQTAANTTGWPVRVITAGLLAGVFAGVLAACGDTPRPAITSPPPSEATPDTGDSGTAPAPAAENRHDTVTPAGHYLAARQALYFNDVGQSARFFLETLEAEADSIPLLRQAFLTQYYYGDIERAAALGRQLERLDVVVPLGGEPGTALAIRKEDWAAALILADRIFEDGTSLVLAGIIRGWSLVAAGQGDAGISALLEAGRLAISKDGGMPPYFRLHAALMAEHLGLTAEAEQRVNGLDSSLRGAHLLLQLAALHARLGNWQDVDRIISTRLSGQFNHRQVRAALQRRADVLPGPHRMIANAVVAMALDERDNDLSLIHI